MYRNLNKLEQKLALTKYFVIEFLTTNLYQQLFIVHNYRFTPIQFIRIVIADELYSSETIIVDNKYLLI